jgi:hypothetical protein
MLNTRNHLTQAEKIFEKFGGVPALHAAMADAGFGRNIATLYRWNLPRSKRGSGGVIPTSAVQAVLAAAKLYGIAIQPEDLLPTQAR